METAQTSALRASQNFDERVFLSTATLRLLAEEIVGSGKLGVVCVGQKGGWWGDDKRPSPAIFSSQTCPASFSRQPVPSAAPETRITPSQESGS